jgi:thiamine biosynthesis lipoprotein
MVAAAKAKAEVERIEQLTSAWNEDGDIAQLNKAAGTSPVRISADAQRVLDAGQTVAAATRGAFDMTVGGIWAMFDVAGSTPPAPEVLAERLHLVDWKKLEVANGAAHLKDPGMAVSPGGVVQGYAAGAALELIPEIYEAKVDVSGDVAVRGTWELAVPYPGGQRDQPLGTVTVTDAVLAVSGGSMHTFQLELEHQHYRIDPRTGEQATGAWLAAVVHKRGGVADGLATGLLVAGHANGSDAVETLGAWAVVVDPDGKAHEIGERGQRIGAWVQAE